jgi:two-component system, response regulator PdtaR
VIRVLIVEDEALIAWDTRLSLELEGFQVCDVAPNGATAIALFEEHRPDVVIMDVNMPGEIDGIEAAHIIRARDNDARIVFLTAFGDPQTMRRIEAVRPNGILLKPAMTDELTLSVRRAAKHAADAGPNRTRAD